LRFSVSLWSTCLVIVLRAELLRLCVACFMWLHCLASLLLMVCQTGTVLGLLSLMFGSVNPLSDSPQLMMPLFFLHISLGILGLMFLVYPSSHLSSSLSVFSSSSIHTNSSTYFIFRTCDATMGQLVHGSSCQLSFIIFHLFKKICLYFVFFSFSSSF
jgi:hypothetical protein